MVDIPGNSTTTATISVGGPVSDSLEVVGDHDWFKITLTVGQSISVALDGLTLEDSYLRIYDASGNLLYENDDINPGINRDSLLAFTANYTGTYYIDVGAWDEGYAGTYQLSVSTYTPPPLATADEIADQLTSGHWGGDVHHFNVTQGGSLTVNLTALSAAGQTLARAALGTWTDIIGVNFVEVSSGGQITFDDNEEGAFSDGTWSGGIITSAHVNVSTQWLQDYGSGLNTYSFQTYIHEIGHALGLGHAGNYNGTATAIEAVVAGVAVELVAIGVAGDAIVGGIALADQRRSGQRQILNFGAQLMVERGDHRVMALAGILISIVVDVTHHVGVIADPAVQPVVAGSTD